MIKPKNLLSAGLIFTIKGLARIFYKTEATWITPKEEIDWDKIKVAVILNHTSLFEPLFFSAIPGKKLWRAIDRTVVPVADVTMNRPIIGRLFKTLLPNVVTITRKRDDTWTNVMQLVEGNSLLAIFPEGRMKRANGLDKYGKPMSVKAGIAEILSKIESGKMLIAYSGGLHHVQAPGQIIPKVFKKIKIAFELVDIREYKEALKAENNRIFRRNVVADLEERMKKHCPTQLS